MHVDTDLNQQLAGLLGFSDILVSLTLHLIAQTPVS